MSKTKFLIFLLGLYACNQTSEKRHSINAEAKKLNDSAVRLAMDKHDYKQSVALLDQAIKIDSNYFSAYNTKFAFLGLIRPNDKEQMLATIKKLNQLKPEYPDFYLYIGIIYIKKGDSIIARKYLNDAIIHYDKILDTMHTSNIAYQVLLMNKGVSLILENQEEKGDKILKQAYDLDIDTSFKKEIAAAIKKSRKEILDSLSFDK